MPKIDMQSSQMAGSKPTASTQSFLDVSEIKQSVIVLQDGSMRAVMVVSATNFSLKSTEEQNALVASYQSLLNSLEFPIQVLMQSRKLDINAYLDKMRGVLQEQSNELLRLQTQEYIEYVSKLVEFASIMNKTFYVVIPYSTATIDVGFLGRLSAMFNPAGRIKQGASNFETGREELMRRVDQVSSELSGMGLQTILLNTEELVELLYNCYNLSSSSPIRIKHIDELEMVRTADGKENA